MLCPHRQSNVVWPFCWPWNVSISVDEAEDALQRGGMAAALTAPEVTRAFFFSDLPVALAVYEWSGCNNQKILLDWTLINNQSDLLSAVQTFAGSARSETEFPTAMGYALGYGAGVFKRAPPCLRQTLDMASDGENNEGFPPLQPIRRFPLTQLQ